MSTRTESGEDEQEGATPRERERTLVNDSSVTWRRVATDRVDSATIVSGFGVVWTGLALAATVGDARGAILGIVVALVWISTSAPVAYAVAHLGAIPILFLESVTPPFVLVELGLLIMLFGTLRRSPAPVRSVVVSIVGLVGLVGLVTALEMADWPIIARAIVLIGTGALLSYLLHRYEYVRVALTEEGTS